MIKRALMVAGVLALGGLLVFGTDVLSYATTAGRRVQRSVKNQVPLEFEIDRARKMVADLVPDIHANMHTIAQEEVEVERLGQAIQEGDSRLASEQTKIVTLRRDLGEGNGTFRYAGRTYTSKQVKEDLARRFERYKTAAATLASQRQMLEAREKSLAAAREKLDGLIAAKRSLEVQVEHLQARLQMVQAAQTTSQIQFDDSRLARVKKLVGDLQTRLDVAQRLIDAEGTFTGEIPVDEPAPEDLAEQIDDYFGAGAGTEADGGGVQASL